MLIVLFRYSGGLVTEGFCCLTSSLFPDCLLMVWPSCDSNRKKFSHKTVGQIVLSTWQWRLRHLSNSCSLWCTALCMIRSSTGSRDEKSIAQPVPSSDLNNILGDKSVSKRQLGSVHEALPLCYTAYIGGNKHRLPRRYGEEGGRWFWEVEEWAWEVSRNPWLSVCWGIMINALGKLCCVSQPTLEPSSAALAGKGDIKSNLTQAAFIDVCECVCLVLGTT